MENKNIYEDIMTRTNGDIYVGVVGPVRVGKSSFITRFMEEFVIPKIANKNTKACAIDELPQSADGATIMTTQPKFVPAESVKIDLKNSISMNVKMIDCVGYFVKGANGDKQEGKPRMVKTPWSKDLMPLESAAEYGTQKVIKEHSTVAILMTTDGSFGEIPRENFVEAENRLVSELKEYQKPFVIVLNSKNPQDEKTKKLEKELEQKHKVSVISLNAEVMTEQDVANVFEKMLNEFPFVSININMPNWLTALSFDSEIISEAANEFKKAVTNLERIGQFDKNMILFENSENFEPTKISNVELGTGKLVFNLKPKEGLFYQVLSNECGMQIKDDFELVAKMKDLAFSKQKYDKLKDALTQAEKTGYGVVLPSVNDLTLDEPELVKQGSNRYGVKLRATAPSLHIMRVDIETEISPMIGSVEQSKDMITYLTDQQKNNPEGLWNINMFGKSMQELMNEGLNGKINRMPVEAQKKMRKTLTRIVNEGKGGIICILL
ncbi:MAG: stage IV sporulation protein A [Clostridia bacterium]|nr:stage IV sporulation protein A [Clostridia bacterium]